METHSHVKFAEAEKKAEADRRDDENLAAAVKGRLSLGKGRMSTGVAGKSEGRRSSFTGHSGHSSTASRASVPANRMSLGNKAEPHARASMAHSSVSRKSTLPASASKSRKSLASRMSEVIPTVRLNAPDAKSGKKSLFGPGVGEPSAFASFDSTELRMLGRRFRKLDQNNDGNLTLEEFMSIPQLQTNPLVSRVIKIFDLDGNGLVNFSEFVTGMSVFSGAADRMQTLRFAFKIYDIDKDGFISNGELFHVLRMMVGDNLGDTELQQAVDKTILYADKDGDGRISFKEFCLMIGEIGMEQKMVFMNL